MSNWYTTRESVKNALTISGSDRDAQVDDNIEAASREIERLTNRIFIPKIEVRSFTWPQRDHLHDYALILDEDLLTISVLTKDGDTETVIPTNSVNLEPANLGPPYSIIEIDRSTAYFFSAGSTPQRAVRVTGSWGFADATRAAGALAEALDASETAVDVSNAALVAVGDTLLIESEQMFVTAKAALDVTAELDGALTAALTETTIAINTGSLINVGEVVLIDAEKMLVESVTANNLQVKRAYDGTALAAHTTADEPVYVFRTLTVVRGANGTTAATHADTTAITKYAPPADIAGLCRALAIYNYEQDQAGWTATVGGPQTGQLEAKGVALDAKRRAVKRQYKRHSVGAV